MSDSKKVDLKIDWATHKAAEYACKHWHYSKCMPAGKMVKIGVWENKKFIGVILFSRGASYLLLKPYGLDQSQGCELTRIALNNHQTTVSRMLSIAIKFLKKNNPGLKLIISFADPFEGHYGGIYQAGNWLYTGDSKPESYVKTNDGIRHRRSIFAKYKTSSMELLPRGFEKIKMPGKHRYLMPLTKEMRKKILPLSKPYPKKADEAGDVPDQGNSGSATLTRPLQ